MPVTGVQTCALPILVNVSAWPLDELEESKRETDMKEALSFGNHKGAVRNPIFLRKFIEKDVVHGYGLFFFN